MPQGKDTQCRKWLLTINNPIEHGLTHEKIKEVLQDFKSVIYYCMADEKGLEEETYHTHLYIHCETQKRFSTVKNAFPQAHIDQAHGTALHNRDYITKEGKWENDEKHGTKIDGTFEEYGDIPIERQGSRTDIATFLDRIENGDSLYQIIHDNPKFLRFIKEGKAYRQLQLKEQYKKEFRELYVEYIYGETRTGKTRHVLEEYGYENVYRVTNYKNPFDRYECEPVILFDEFRSQLKIAEMLTYLEGYPIPLPCRFEDKQACFTKVYIISNEHLLLQYPNVQIENPETWKAFLARINKMYQCTKSGKYEREMIGLNNDKEYVEIPDESTKDLPFTTDWKQLGLFPGE